MKIEELLPEEDIELDVLPKEELEQEFSSKMTSFNQIPRLFKIVDWKPNTINLDYGGGRFDNATKFLHDLGVTNLIYDPFNRCEEHNSKILKKLYKSKADTATIVNVLNVIKEPHIRKHVMDKVKKLVKPGGEVYIIVYYDGTKKIPGKSRSGCWQENIPLKTYLDEIRQIFSDVRIENNMIIAKG
jgi:hypothetical protein